MPTLKEMTDAPLQGVLGLVGLFGGMVVGAGIGQGAGEVALFVLIAGLGIAGLLLGSWLAWAIDQKNKNK